jgi:hypothetical protein
VIAVLLLPLLLLLIPPLLPPLSPPVPEERDLRLDRPCRLLGARLL